MNTYCACPACTHCDIRVAPPGRQTCGPCRSAYVTAMHLRREAIRRLPPIEFSRRDDLCPWCRLPVRPGMTL